MASILAKIALLIVAASAAPDMARRFGVDPASSEPGWLDTVTSGPLSLGAALTVLALRLPSVVADGWFEFRFRRGIDGYRPVSFASYLSTTMLLAVVSLAVVIGAAGSFYRLAAVIGDRRLLYGLLVGAVVSMVATAAVVERWFRRLPAGGEQPLDPESTQAVAWRDLADRHGLADVSFLTGPAGGAQDVPNASAMGLGPNRRVVVTEALLAEEPATRDFVVAHELAHLTRHHVAVRTGTTMFAAAAVVAVVGFAAESELPWKWFGTDPYQPVGLPAVALMVMLGTGLVAPVQRWLSRAQERSADNGAVSMVRPPPTADAAGLHLATTADLDPPWWARLYGEHPPPAERLELLARHGARGSRPDRAEPARTSTPTS